MPTVSKNANPGFWAMLNSYKGTFELSELPDKRKRAGVLAHKRVYKKMLQYVTFTHLSNFLSIAHPCGKDVNFKIFFEVTLGSRIADCIVLAVSKQGRVCYVIELKTSLGSKFILNDVKAAQISQGLSQLLDSTTYLYNHAPKDTEAWTIVPHLLFKCQKTLQTIYSETPKLKKIHINTRGDKLSAFLYAREDAGLRRSIIPNKGHKKMAKGKFSMVTQSKALPKHKARIITKGQKSSHAVQKPTAKQATQLHQS
ncbi:hypothetical protein KM546_gp17 [Porcine lymphotropic herpesvirus 3]|uniref:Protein UL24 homolog n=1 Tax=Suid gammaherpesvirus 5 TaxID=1960251 RepID=Q8B401_9GAMA|nr:hypothetical protein KM546_gp17 [Porcine lymphotropic herpesvirus 3]AAO12324.1 unknown [Porcine lymphotropic herpesvirus 3]